MVFYIELKGFFFPKFTEYELRISHLVSIRTNNENFYFLLCKSTTGSLQLRKKRNYLYNQAINIFTVFIHCFKFSPAAKMGCVCEGVGDRRKEACLCLCLLFPLQLYYFAIIKNIPQCL